MNSNLATRTALAAGMLVLVVFASGCAPVTSVPTTEPMDTVATAEMTPTLDAAVPETGTQIDPVQFQRDMRKLWEDHIQWTRVYIIDAAADLPETDASAERLLQNQTDIGEAFKPFYGDEAGNQLTSLLSDHISIAVDLIAAAKAGDSAATADADTRWRANAAEIAALLATANPDHWSQPDMESMLNAHLDATLEEATARLNGDWEADVAAYDSVRDQILEMADILAQGVMAQFPDKFSPAPPDSQVELRLAMDKLWEDHVSWTRFYIISATSDLPDQEVAAARLLRNQEDIGAAIVPFYGDEAGAQLTALLKTHIQGAVDLLTAARAGDTAAVESARAAWAANAEEIAAFLSAANADNWPQAEMAAMMQSHLDLTFEEASARLNGDWEGDIAAYDAVHDQILDMSQMLSDGLIAQFPDQFQ